jgi:hypothetical protein
MDDLRSLTGLIVELVLAIKGARSLTVSVLRVEVVCSSSLDELSPRVVGLSPLANTLRLQMGQTLRFFVSHGSTHLQW